MNSRWISNALLVFVLSGAGLAVACGGSNPEGKYRASDGSVTLELKSGKAGFNYGPVHIDGAYTVDGDKLTIRPLEGATEQTMVFTINKDGSLTGPPGMDIQRLVKTN
jgi:hypothetical protein